MKWVLLMILIFVVNSELDDNLSDDETHNPSQKRKTVGPKIQHLTKLGPKRFLDRMQEIYNEMLEYCEKENITMEFLCAVLGRRACSTPNTKHHSPTFAKNFDLIAHGEDPSAVKCCVHHSLAMQVYLKIGWLRYINMTQYMSGYVNWINSDLLYNRWNELCPPLYPTHNQWYDRVHSKWANEHPRYNYGEEDNANEDDQDEANVEAMNASNNNGYKPYETENELDNGQRIILISLIMTHSKYAIYYVMTHSQTRLKSFLRLPMKLLETQIMSSQDHTKLNYKENILTLSCPPQIRRLKKCSKDWDFKCEICGKGYATKKHF